MGGLSSCSRISCMKTKRTEQSCTITSWKCVAQLPPFYVLIKLISRCLLSAEPNKCERSAEPRRKAVIVCLGTFWPSLARTSSSKLKFARIHSSHSFSMCGLWHMSKHIIRLYILIWLNKDKDALMLAWDALGEYCLNDWLKYSPMNMQMQEEQEKWENPRGQSGETRFQTFGSPQNCVALETDALLWLSPGISSPAFCPMSSVLQTSWRPSGSWNKVKRISVCY